MRPEARVRKHARERLAALAEGLCGECMKRSRAPRSTSRCEECLRYHRERMREVRRARGGILGARCSDDPSVPAQAQHRVQE